MEGIQVRINKNGEKSYRAQVRVKKRYVSKTFKSLTKAKLWRQKTICSIEDQTYFKTAEAKKHTLGETISRYERDVLPNKPRAKQEQQLSWWKEELGAHSLADISPALIVERRDKLSNSITRYGRKMAATTVLRYLAALSNVFTVAVMEWGWLEESPMKKVSKPKQGLLRVRFLGDEERDRLLKSCKESTNPYLYPYVVLALATGMRTSEILSLTTSAVDLINSRILLEQTKNGERRSIPLKGHALAVIQEVILQKRQNIHYLFPSHNGSKPMDLRFPWEKALKRASIHNFRRHDLRHSCASYLAMNGASLAEIAEVLGHKTLSMVKRYAHLSENHTAGVVSRMNEKIFR